MSAANRTDLTGRTFHRWTVMGQMDIVPIFSRTVWQCRCICGTVRGVIGQSLVFGLSKSCGCLKRETSSQRSAILNYKHGATKTPTHNCWLSMNARCYTPSNDSYTDYGGRGIRICSRWRESYLNFLMDMGEKPRGMSIGRKDNDGDYCKDNCRWETLEQQASNKRNTVYLEYNGETLPIQAWSKITGLSYGTIWQRIRKGWPAAAVIERENGDYFKSRRI